MKIEILNEQENPLLKRKQFEVKIIHDATTPSIEEIRQKISVAKEVGKGVVIVESFKSQYGSRETIGTVKVYQTKERALETEPRHSLIKNGLIVVEGKEKPKPKEEPKEAEGEKPKETKEEKKEEKPEEKKEEQKPAEEKDDKKPDKPKEDKKAKEEKPAEETKEVE